VSDPVAIETRFAVEKVDPEQRRVFGWVSVVTKDGEPVEDWHGHIIDVEDLEEAIYGFAKDSGIGDTMHDYQQVSTLIECCVFTKAKQEALGIDLGFEGAWAGFEVADGEVWEKIKSGELGAFSIAGTAIEVEEEA
jgi:hypothetical protein